jgi:lipid-A-disaccharide synthase-like uncharacterized protein
MELDAFVAILIGVYQLLENLLEIMKSGKVNATAQYVLLSILAGLLWLSHQYRTGANVTTWVTVLSILVNLYMLRVIYLKEKKDKKV